jgi:hypothetical protein
MTKRDREEDTLPNKKQKVVFDRYEDVDIITYGFVARERDLSNLLRIGFLCAKYKTISRVFGWGRITSGYSHSDLPAPKLIHTYKQPIYVSKVVSTVRQVKILASTLCINI